MNQTPNLTISHFQKYSSSKETFPLNPTKKTHSLEENPENIDDTIEFKLIWLINNLAKMSLDMNRCYVILERIDINEENSLDMLLQIFLDKYFTSENGVKEENNESFINKISQIGVISKLFNPQRVNKPNEIGSELKKEFIIEENIEKKRCLICNENKNEVDFFNNNNIPHDFCNICLIGYLTQKIFSYQVIDIKCPDDCGLIIKDEEIQLILSENRDLYKKYQKLKNLALLNNDPNIRWCVRPQCTGYMRGDKSSKMLKCQICSQEMCYLCRNEWHEGKNCKEAMDIEFKKYVDRVEVKECPNCKSKIEKNEGCNHMTCSRCDYQFCWICLSKYSKNHYKWYNYFGCPNMQFSNIRMNFIKILINKYLYLFKILFFISAIGPLIIVGFLPIVFLVIFFGLSLFLIPRLDYKLYDYGVIGVLALILMPLILILSPLIIILAPTICFSIPYVLFLYIAPYIPR